ncbi:ABC transporter permease subunit, partial [candidate division KSB3 bacterium]|nr:ABC transporter permease subunit [candidate division KSB3 bacterium]
MIIRSILKLRVIYAILFLALVVWWFPLLWLILTSVRELSDTLAYPPVWIFTPTLEHYVTVFHDSYFIQALINSIITATSSTGIVLFIAIPAAYVLARYDFKNLEFYIISTKMTPPIVILFASYLMFFQLGLLQTRSALIILHIAFNLPLGVWLLKGFFQNIPVEIEDAAQIDGCNQWQVITSIVVPLTLPGIFITGILCFMFSWMEFLFASTITGGQSLTVPVMV